MDPKMELREARLAALKELERKKQKMEAFISARNDLARVTEAEVVRLRDERYRPFYEEMDIEYLCELLKESPKYKMPGSNEWYVPTDAPRFGSEEHRIALEIWRARTEADRRPSVREVVNPREDFWSRERDR